MNITKKIILIFGIFFILFAILNNYLILRTIDTQYFYKLLINSIIIAAAFLIIASVFMYYNLTLHFRNTIEKLNDIITLKNYSARLENQNIPREFTTLNNSINDLLEIIEERETQLLDYNKNLNDKIKLSTLQLNEKILELKISNEKLIEADKVKDDFLSVMAHELKTPITTISAYIETMQSGIVEEKDKTEFYEIIISEITRLTRLINNILDITKYERNKLKLNYEEINLIKNIKQICAGFSRELQPKRLILKTDFPEETNILISVDADSLKQVFYNLINNAIKFNKKNGSIRVSSEILAAKDILTKESLNAEKYLCVHIKDTGIGITEDKISKIWEKFGRAADDYYEGVGLGLTVSKNIVALHNGFIKVESVYEQGSQFSVYLPI